MEHIHKAQRRRTLPVLVVGAVLAVAYVAAATNAKATDITPSFAGAPAGWTVDRYAPDSFGDVGTVNGRNHVLGIGIGPNGSAPNRPSAYSSSFYNTQGESHPVSGGVGSILTADLYVPLSWGNPTNGVRRTDMWGVGVDSASSVVDYPIIGFTNATLADSFVGFRVWNDQGTGAWVELGAAVNYDAWNNLTIAWDGANFDYSVNGVLAATIAADPTMTGFSSIIMQAYNYDPSLPLLANPYTAYWSDAETTSVPEPGSLGLMLVGSVGTLGFGAWRRRRRSTAEMAAAA